MQYYGKIVIKQIHHTKVCTTEHRLRVKNHSTNTTVYRHVQPFNADEQYIQSVMYIDGFKSVIYKVLHRKKLHMKHTWYHTLQFHPFSMWCNSNLLTDLVEERDTKEKKSTIPRHYHNSFATIHISAL